MATVVHPGAETMAETKAARLTTAQSTMTRGTTAMGLLHGVGTMKWSRIIRTTLLATAINSGAETMVETEAARLTNVQDTVMQEMAAMLLLHGAVGKGETRASRVTATRQLSGVLS